MTGEFTRKITVETNDPRHPKETLICKGRILEPVTLKPKRIYFRQVSRTEPGQKQRIAITPGDGGPLKLKLMPLESKYFEAMLREIETGKHYELEVTLKTPLPAKTVRANLKLETGLEQAPNVTVLATALPRPRVVASPRRFSVPAKRGPDWHQAVRLEWDDDKPHKILGATTTDPGMQVKVIETEGKQEVVLEIPENYEPRPGVKAVTVRTDDAEMPNVRVPVYMARKAPSRPAQRSRPASLQSAKPKIKTSEDQGTKPEDKKSPLRKPPALTLD